jgi:hypothetical protein
MFKTKLLKRMILMVSMLGMFLLSMPGVSSAEDVWCYSQNGYAYYLSSESVTTTTYHPPYRGIVKMVREDTGTQRDVIIAGFANENDVIMAYVYGKDGTWGSCGKVGTFPLLYAVWQAMTPYL